MSGGDPLFSFTKIVDKQLSDYCTEKEIIPPEQHGFRKYSSCETALIKASDTWLRAIDNGDIVGAIMIDLSKAFDTIPHAILVKELQRINVNRESLEWFISYLSE